MKASKLVDVAKSYTCTNLHIQKLFALTTLKEEIDVKSFLENYDVENMSVREIEKEVKLYKKELNMDKVDEKKPTNKQKDTEEEGYYKSIVDENTELKLKIKQLERENEQLYKQKDNEINRYKTMYENEKRYKEMYINITKMGTGSVVLSKPEYRKLAKVCHPDNGGSEELMNIISKLYQK